MTQADRIARAIEEVASTVGRIRALSRTEPHCFVEEKDAAEKRLRKLAVEVRDTFGAAPVCGEPGLLQAPRTSLRPGRLIPVVVRRRQA